MASGPIGDKVVVVTGGASAIGHAISTELVSSGNNVVLTYRHNEDRATDLAERLRSDFKAKVVALRYDLENPEAPAELALRLKEQGLVARGLVHNAVVWPGRGSDALKVGDAVDANITGTLELVNELLPAIVDRSGGRIVFISSNIATDGMAGSVVYGTLKASLLGACRSLAWELGPKGATVNVVAPGLTRTERTSAIPVRAVENVVDHTPISRLVTPQEVASVVSFLSSTYSSGVTGECIRVAGGY